MDPQNQRESFGSRLGFILVSAGCAIGIGNVWRFPTVTGQYGGGIFVLFYLLFLVLMGLPVLTMELAVGRAGRGAARSAYKALEPGLCAADDVLHHRLRLDGRLLLPLPDRQL